MTSLPDLEQPVPGRLTIRYRPEAGHEIVENPPRFTWLPEIDPGAQYVLRLSQDPSFPALKTFVHAGIALNFFTPDAQLAPGKWYWAYAECEPGAATPRTGWSVTRSFNLRPDLPQTPLPSRAARLQSAGQAHPRLWLSPEGLRRAREAVEKDPSIWGWDKFMEVSALPWMDFDIMPEPSGYPGHKRTAPVWRATYIACQELIYAIRHLAIAGQVTRDADLLARAQVWLLEAASWDPAGTTSRSYSDEWAFRVTVALAWGYDWLHDEMDEDSRARVRAALLVRTREIADHVMRGAAINLFPYDSHAVRAVSAVMVPASIALLHDEPEAQDWLDFATEFLFTVYSPWGDAEGGWAEGTHYWMTGMAYLTEAANLLRSYQGLDLYRRPFFQVTADFPLFTRAPNTRRASFGDDATLGEALCLKMGYLLRQFAGVTGNPAYQWYFEAVRAGDKGTEKEFYNWGWWDFNFDDLIYRHDFEGVKAALPEPADRLRHFRGIGWVALQQYPDDPARHVQFTFKSSPFGSVSHSHADQNAFCLSAYGEDLAIHSGHYIAYGSTMHMDWRRQTLSKNAVLIDGEGQYAGTDKARAIRASGRILAAEDRGDHVFMRGDATAAYAERDPDITLVLRDVYFVHDNFFVVIDQIDAARAVTLDWRLHANAPMELGQGAFRYRGSRAGFYGQFLYSEGARPVLQQQTGFPGVEPAEFDGLSQSSCLTAAYPAAKRHRVATLLVPYRAAQPKRVFSFIDDQGFAANLYFTDSADRTFKITIEKTLAAAAKD